MMPDHYGNPARGCMLKGSDKGRLERQGNRGKATETFEAKPDEFQQKVNAGYLQIAKNLDIPIIDASGTIEEVFDLIVSKLWVV